MLMPTVLIMDLSSHLMKQMTNSVKMGQMGMLVDMQAYFGSISMVGISFHRLMGMVSIVLKPPLPMPQCQSQDCGLRRPVIFHLKRTG